MEIIFLFVFNKFNMDFYEYKHFIPKPFWKLRDWINLDSIFRQRLYIDDKYYISDFLLQNQCACYFIEDIINDKYNIYEINYMYLIQNPAVIHLFGNTFDEIITYYKKNLLEFDHYDFLCLLKNPKIFDIIKNDNDFYEFISKFQYSKYVIFYYLSFNTHPNAIQFIEKNIQFIDFNILSQNKNALYILNNNKDKIKFKSLLFNKNPNIIKLFEDYKYNISTDHIFANPIFIDLLKDNVHHIDWDNCYHILSNPHIDVIDIIKNNYNKITCDELLLSNHSIFTYDYDFIKQYKQELNENIIQEFMKPNKNRWQTNDDDDDYP